MRFKAWVFAMLVGLSFSAFAGKQERDLMTKQITPAIEAAQKVYKDSCGCALAISVDQDTLKTMDELRQARNVANSIKEGAAKYCTDDASKKAVCQMKTLTVTKAKPTAFTFKDGKGVAATDGQSYPSWDMMTRQLDK